MIPNIAYLSSPTETFALDTDAVEEGAPAKPGSRRMHLHPTFGVQIYELRLNESGGSIAAGEGTALASGTAVTGLTIGAKSTTNTLPLRFGGVAVTSVADDYWGWFLVEGIGEVKLNTDDVAADGLVYCLASGLFDDGAGATTSTVVGVFLEAETTNSGLATAEISRSMAYSPQWAVDT